AAERIDRRQLVVSDGGDDRIAMGLWCAGSSGDQTAIPSAREGRDVALNVDGVAPDDGGQLHTQRRRHGLYGAELCYFKRIGGIPNDCNSRHARCYLLEQL